MAYRLPRLSGALSVARAVDPLDWLPAEQALVVENLEEVRLPEHLWEDVVCPGPLYLPRLRTRGRTSTKELVTGRSRPDGLGTLPVVKGVSMRGMRSLVDLLWWQWPEAKAAARLPQHVSFGLAFPGRSSLRVDEAGPRRPTLRRLCRRRPRRLRPPRRCQYPVAEKATKALQLFLHTGAPLRRFVRASAPLLLSSAETTSATECSRVAPLFCGFLLFKP